MYRNDNRTVITLDAGGTNFVFGAVRPISYSAPCAPTGLLSSR